MPTIAQNASLTDSSQYKTVEAKARKNAIAMGKPLEQKSTEPYLGKLAPKMEEVVKSEEAMTAAEWAAKMDEDYFRKTGIRPVSTTFLREAPPDKIANINKITKSLSSESAKKIYKAFAK